MADILVPVGFAIFIWWFSTGLILWLDRLPDTGVRWGLVLSSALAVSAMFGLAHTAQQTTPTGAYCAFTCTLIIWGWHELSFLSGWLTGPQRHALEPGTTGWPRFVQSVRAILWHELGLLATGAAVLAVTWNAQNTVGIWTYGVLWAMRLSAKLNLFFGVRNFSEAFLPVHLKYLQSFFRRRRMNAFFPLAVGAATVLAVTLVQRALDPALGAGAQAGQWLVASLLILAIVEHWMLVLPLETTALWRWALARSEKGAAEAYGSGGAGGAGVSGVSGVSGGSSGTRPTTSASTMHSRAAPLAPMATPALHLSPFPPGTPPTVAHQETLLHAR